MLLTETLIKYPNKYRWNVSLKPANASLASVTFRSSNKSIATISKSGVITPLKEGNITMTAKYKKSYLRNDVSCNDSIKEINNKASKDQYALRNFQDFICEFQTMECI